MDDSAGKKCCKFCSLQFHYSKLWFFHHNWKAFTYTPLLPYDWRFQAIYLIYRWLIAFYFLGWIIGTWATTSGPIYLVFLTNWGFITYNIYLHVSAISTTVSYLSAHFICKRDENEFSREEEFTIKKPAGCCGYSDNKLSWYQMIHWFFYTIGNEIAFAILVLYWCLLYRGGSVDGFNANTHLINGLVALVDLWVSGVPINFLHFIYLMLYGTIYVIFTGIYFAASGESVYESVLNYQDGVGVALGAIFGTVFIFLPLVHTLFYFMYLGKVWILHCFYQRMNGSAENKEAIKDEEADIAVL